MLHVLHVGFLSRLKAMTPAERIRLALGLTDAAWRFLDRLRPEEAQRRLDLVRLEPWDPASSELGG